MIRDLRRRSWVAPEQMSGIAEYLPELHAIAKKNRELAEAGGPVRFPAVQLATGRVTLIPLETLEYFAAYVDDAEQLAITAEIRDRRRIIKRDGFDTRLRAALIRKYGLRIREAS
jgi:hypothetical protein